MITSCSAVFGTDGIRGEVNYEPMSIEIMMRLGQVLGTKYKNLVVGKDNRASSDMVESAITAGLLCVGSNVDNIGCVSTPVVSFFSKKESKVGIMISASHNIFTDNGVKFFASDGYKFSCEMENEVQLSLYSGDFILAKACAVQRVQDKRCCLSLYDQFVISQAKSFGFSSANKIKVVFDCANGSITEIVSRVCEGLISDFHIINDNNDGMSINWCCGVMNTQNISQFVLTLGADIGIAFDGDGDRIVVCDENGIMIDCDQVLAFLADYMLKQGSLNNNWVVSNVVSNVGLGNFLDSIGLNLYRTNVGDRFVSHKMRELGSNLGGEKSGHIVLSDFNSCSDGLIVALRLISICSSACKPVSDLFEVFEPVPQWLLNFKSCDENVLERKSVCLLLEDIKYNLGEKGRFLLRKSGTEKGVIRVMIESYELSKFSQLLQDLENEINDN